MALALDDVKLHCNVIGTDDDAVLARCLLAAGKHVEAQLGFALDDAAEFPTGTPADVEQAVLMVAAHYYENREATLVGVVAQELPLGALAILANHRRYTYG
ncbi:head-tail connector protein [Mangrovicella endophytica]|uniref:head-tail connector protein n=1 Tax=Mangrovicella endophytica TaxID=2066697 RepID=UPI000C9DBD70|nr:head-tail connector protein [Mangrovicella endophytica]